MTKVHLYDRLSNLNCVVHCVAYGIPASVSNACACPYCLSAKLVASLGGPVVTQHATPNAPASLPCHSCHRANLEERQHVGVPRDSHLRQERGEDQDRRARHHDGAGARGEHGRAAQVDGTQPPLPPITPTHTLSSTPPSPTRTRKSSGCWSATTGRSTRSSTSSRS